LSSWQTNSKWTLGRRRVNPSAILGDDNAPFGGKSTSRGASWFGCSFPIGAAHEFRSIIWTNRLVAWPAGEQIHNGRFQFLINGLNSPFSTCI